MTEAWTDERLAELVWDALPEPDNDIVLATIVHLRALAASDPTIGEYLRGDQP